MTITCFSILGGKISPLIFWCLGFTYLEAGIVLIVTVLFSLITNTTASVIYSILVFILGHGFNEALTFNFVKSREMLAAVIKSYGYFFPDFSKLNIKNFLLYQNTLESNYLIFNGFYGILYGATLVFISCIIFSRKNLD